MPIYPLASKSVPAIMIISFQRLTKERKNNQMTETKFESKVETRKAWTTPELKKVSIEQITAHTRYQGNADGHVGPGANRS
jgi:hypothetical protein